MDLVFYLLCNDLMVCTQGNVQVYAYITCCMQIFYKNTNSDYYYIMEP